MLHGQHLMLLDHFTRRHNRHVWSELQIFLMKFCWTSAGGKSVWYSVFTVTALIQITVNWREDHTSHLCFILLYQAQGQEWHKGDTGWNWEKVLHYIFISLLTKSHLDTAVNDRLIYRLMAPLSLVLLKIMTRKTPNIYCCLHLDNMGVRNHLDGWMAGCQTPSAPHTFWEEKCCVTLF